MSTVEQLQIGVELGPRVDLLEPDTCQAKWQVQPGEVFVVRGVTGLEHVIACGDSRRIRFVLALVDLVTASSWLWVSDPPYGIRYSQRTQPQRKGQGGNLLPTRRKDRDFDGKADVLDTRWMPIWADLAPPHAVYLFTLWRVLDPWEKAMESIGCKPQQRIVWDRMHFGMGDVSRYGSQLEDILCWYAQGRAPSWEKREGNLWTAAAGVCIDGGAQVGHATQKPVALYHKAIDHGCISEDEVVVDMFAGSGPVVLAADGLARRALAVELAPRYVALILERCERAGMRVESRRSIR